MLPTKNVSLAMILVKCAMGRRNLIVSRAIQDKREKLSMMKPARKLYACVSRVIMKILCQKIVFLATRIVVHARAKNPLPVPLVLKAIC